MPTDRKTCRVKTNKEENGCLKSGMLNLDVRLFVNHPDL
jgi:hypothetical protein